MLLRLLFIYSFFAITHLWACADSRKLEDLIKEEDYIETSLVVVSPGNAIYSAGGHLALRMKCPYQDIDYIYEFDATLDSDESLIFQFINGTLKGKYIRLFTLDFLSKAHGEERIINEYVLNLSPEQEVCLWENIDNAVDSKEVIAFSPSKNNCCSMILSVIESSLHSELFSSPNISNILNGSGRKYLNDFFGNSQWKGLLWNLILGLDFDQSQESLYLFYPKVIGKYLSLVINPINHKPLIDQKSRVIGFDNTERSSHLYITPQIVFTILFIISVILTFRNIKGKSINLSHWFDLSLIGICTILGCIIWYMFFASILSSNLYLNILMLVFTPMPILLIFLHKTNVWIWYLKISIAILIILLIIIKFFLQMQLYCLWLFMIVLLIRGLYNIYSKKSLCLTLKS